MKNNETTTGQDVPSIDWLAFIGEQIESYEMSAKRLNDRRSYHAAADQHLRAETLTEFLLRKEEELKEKS